MTGGRVSAVGIVVLALTAGFAGAKLLSRCQNQGPQRKSFYSSHRLTLFSVLPAARDRLVMFGDSLTDWGEWPELLGRYDVVNRGIAGNTIADLLARVPSAIDRESRAIALMVGINDLNAGHSVGEVTRDYRLLLNTLRSHAPKAAIVIQSILPINNALFSGAATNANISATNVALRELSQEFSAEFLDVAAVMRTPDGQLAPELTSDGVHLNGAGYLRWAAVLRANP